jgi:Zn-dependent protease
LQSGDLIIAVFEFVLLIFSLSVHECAHAWMASRLGDQTAREMGRVTLNPVAHVDPVGTLILPALMIFGPFIGFSLFGGMLIGWAKPTPVITRNFRKIVRDDNLTTLAGPASNLLITLAAFTVLAVIILFQGQLPQQGSVMTNVQALVILCRLAIQVNLVLFFFNLLPIPPLDGSRIVRNLLPYNAVQRYDRIPIWASYLLMIFFGPMILRLLLSPSLAVVYFALRHI